MNLVDNIRIFRKVAEVQSFSKAARELRVTQPTISKAIASLEQELGIQIFRRSSRGLTLTDEGQSFLKIGGGAVDQLDAAVASTKHEKLLLKGQLKISCSLVLGRLILVPMLDAFRKLHPELKLNFHLSDHYVNLVEEGIDLAIRLGNLEDSSLKAIKIGSWGRALFASPKYIKKHGQPKKIEDLVNHRLIYYNTANDRPIWKFKTSAGGEASFPFDPYIQADGSDFIREAVLNGLGITYAPTWIMIEPEKKGAVTRMLEELCGARFPIHAVTVGPNSMSAKQKAFAEFLKSQFDQIPELRATKS